MTLRLDFTMYIMFLVLAWPLQPGDAGKPEAKLVQINGIIDKPTCLKIAKELIEEYKNDGVTGFHTECIPIRNIL